MKRLIHVCAAAILAACAVTAMPALAASQLKAAPASLNPGLAYVLVRLGERSEGLWNRLTLAPYDEPAADIRGYGRAKANPVPPRTDRRIAVSPKPFLAEADHVRTYLMEVNAGLYVIEASPTTCFCLGSYSVYLAPGVITDLGFIYIAPENGTSPWAALSELRVAADIEMRGYTLPDAMAIVPPANDTPVPDGLAGLPRTPAAYRPAERFGNHQGLLINRALPIGGGK